MDETLAFIKANKAIKASNYFFGKINYANATALQFTQFKTALTAGTINVVVMGDSISTESANNLTGTESYFKELKDHLIKKYPGKTFVFTNLAIGGTRITEWNTSKTFNSVAKTWIEHVNSASPDLLIIGFGMNDTQYFESKQFKYNLKSMLDYITANFAKQPSIAVVTTPLPTYSGPYANTQSKNARNMSAFTARSYGYDRNCYVIDVNRIFNIKRNGIDARRFITQALATTDAEITPLATGNFTKVGGEYSLQTTAQYLTLNTSLANFKLAFDVKFSGVPLGDENLNLTFNLSSLAHIINILPNKAAGVCYIRPYMDNPDSAELGTTQTSSWNDTVTWNDSAYRTVLIERVGDWLEIFVNGVSVLKDKVHITNVGDVIKFGKGVGSTGIVTMRNIKLYNCLERTYMPTLTDKDIYDDYGTGDGTTRLPYGGNGINHPTSIGIEEVYVPAIREFIADLPNS